MKIIFMGTPDFAVETLKAIVENDFEVVGVITMADKKSGRGQKISQSPVKIYAEKQNLKVLQPTNLKDEAFIAELKELNADLQIVVAFRMLPEVVWNMPKLGTVNLHASILPNYRGAAPINWAIINGEKVTGNSTFFLQHQIDTGNIIYSEEVEITDTETAGSLHDKLMYSGGLLMVKTLKSIEKGKYPQVPQTEIIKKLGELKNAPKIFKDDCKINWQKDIEIIYNFIRGLSPYPAAWSELKNTQSGKVIAVKVFETEKILENHDFKTGTLISDNKKFLKIAVKGGFINVNKLQLAGKKNLKIDDLLRGFDIEKYELQTNP